MLKIDVIVSATKEPEDFVSGIFTRPKKDGDHMMISNLKKSNNFLKI